MGQDKQMGQTLYMDRGDEGMQWGRISRWDRQCTWIGGMKGCNGEVEQDKRIRRIVYMDKVGEGMQWAG